jgi:hypothetical protein
MEATFSSETSVDFQRTTLHYVPEDSTLHNHSYETLEFQDLIAGAVEIFTKLVPDDDAISNKNICIINMLRTTIFDFT